MVADGGVYAEDGGEEGGTHPHAVAHLLPVAGLGQGVDALVDLVAAGERAQDASGPSSTISKVGAVISKPLFSSAYSA